MFTRYLNGIRNTVTALACIAVVCLHADDWPTYQHDVARSGITKEELKPPLWEIWSFVPRHPPAPAWGDPKPKPQGHWQRAMKCRELPRLKFDDAFHVAAVGESVYFGSSSDNTVYCLDAGTGNVRWTRITGAPIRLAPMVWHGRLFVGSDDGHAYCLDANDGREIWQFRAAPTPEKVLGHGRMMSLWAIRTGVLVDKGLAYFGAGIFPHEGLYLYAVRAEDGKLAWVNDSFGWSRGRGISPQGYLLASATRLFLPSGRSTPVAVDRADGRFLYQSSGGFWANGGPFGGTYALLADGKLYSGAEKITAYDQQKGRSGFAWFHGRRLIVTPEVFYMLTDREMSALDQAIYPQASRELQKFEGRHWPMICKKLGMESKLRAARQKAKTSADAAKQLEAVEKEWADFKREFDALIEGEEKARKAIESAKKWRIDCDCADSMILAGGFLFAGGEDKVIAVDAATGAKVWTGNVNGRAKGLAVANGRLFVSTDKGNIHCFGQKQVATAKRVSPPTESTPYPDDDLASFYRETAESVVRDSDINRGYCLVIGAGTGRLAYELAKRTELMIYAVEQDAKKVKVAREALSAAGHYGARVSVEQGSLETLSYPDYFANLIVCENAFSSGEISTLPEELVRVLKPCGGVAYLGVGYSGMPAGGEGHCRPLAPESLTAWYGRLKNLNLRLTTKGSKGVAWAKITRGRLKGAGSWTHQYAEPGNTACGDDQIVKCPLGILWFGRPGPGTMHDRHSKATAPLAANGRMFVRGENAIMAYDAYNGLPLWERESSGATRLGANRECSNLAASDDSLFVVTGAKCLRLDQATGETKTTYELPPARDPASVRRRWGYVACVGSTLFGSAMQSGGSSDVFFALDMDSGSPRWIHYGTSMMHISIAVGDGKVFLIEGSVTPEQRQEANASKGGIVRLVMALDAATGKVYWQRPVDLTNCIRIGAGGGDVTIIYRDKVVLLCMAPWNGHFWKQFMAGEFERRSIIALSSDSGRELWSDKIGYRSRPLVIGDTIYAEPWAHDLHTGKPRMRTHPVTGKQVKWQMSRYGHHCGCMAAAPNFLMFRSDSIGYYDLIADDGVTNFGGQRPGCWINFIAANGLIQIPEASSGCLCAFPIHCTVVLHPKKKDRAWHTYSCPGSMTPVKHLAVNLGAPGDRKDSTGTLWLAYPRPYRNEREQNRLALVFSLDTTVIGGGRYYRHNPDLVSVKGTAAPWIFTSGCLGLTRCTVPLAGEGEAGTLYTVRLSFTESLHDKPGKRVFDIKLQDRVVLKDFDILKEARGQNKALVKEFKDVEVRGTLKIELVPEVNTPGSAHLPILQGFEIVRQGLRGKG